MSCQIDMRFKDAGFVIVDVGHIKNERRMLFGPANEVLHKNDPDLNDYLCLTPGNWGPLTFKQIQQCKEFLQNKFPNKKIMTSR